MPITVTAQKLEPLITWERFLERWQVITSAEEAVGLLHCGYKMKMQIPSDFGSNGDYVQALANIPRDVFYFDIIARSNAGELPTEVGTKAYEMLAANLFRIPRVIGYPDYDDPNYCNWKYRICSTELLSCLEKFFRIQRDHRFRVPNLELRLRDHVLDQAKSFLFCLMAYLIRPTCGKNKEDLAVRKERATAWAAEAIAVSGHVKELERYWLCLTNEAVARLTNIALSTQLGDRLTGQTRPVTSIEEAVYAGSDVALFLLERRVRLEIRNNLSPE